MLFNQALTTRDRASNVDLINLLYHYKILKFISLSSNCLLVSPILSYLQSHPPLYIYHSFIAVAILRLLLQAAATSLGTQHLGCCWRHSRLIDTNCRHNIGLLETNFENFYSFARHNLPVRHHSHS
jgi:hypothetical protein